MSRRSALWIGFLLVLIVAWRVVRAWAPAPPAWSQSRLAAREPEGAARSGQAELKCPSDFDGMTVAFETRPPTSSPKRWSGRGAVRIASSAGSSASRSACMASRCWRFSLKDLRRRWGSGLGTGSGQGPIVRGAWSGPSCPGRRRGWSSGLHTARRAVRQDRDTATSLRRRRRAGKRSSPGGRLRGRPLGRGSGFRLAKRPLTAPVPATSGRAGLSCRMIAARAERRPGDAGEERPGLNGKAL